MAKILSQHSLLSKWWQVALFGAAMALVLWGLSVFFSVFIVDPITCGVNGSSQACVQSLRIGTGLADIITALLALVLAIRYGMHRPILVTLASVAMILNLALWVNGIDWIEAIGWCVLVGALVFLLYYWINRMQRIAVAIVLSSIILIAEYIILISS